MEQFQGLLPHQGGGFFPVQLPLHRQDEHVVPAAFPHGDQGLAHQGGVQAQGAGHLQAVGELLAGVGVGGVGDLLSIQQPQGVGLFQFFLCHYSWVSPLSASRVISTSRVVSSSGRYRVMVTWSPGW